MTPTQTTPPAASRQLFQAAYDRIDKTIYEQIGGHKFAVMTGADAFVGLERGLMFAFKGFNKANKCRITLTLADTYTVEFFKIRGSGFTQTATFENIYADQLQAIFTQYTGLDTAL